MSASAKFQLDMIQIELVMAKFPLNSSYTGRARSLNEVIIADCKMHLADPGKQKNRSEQINKEPSLTVVV